MAYIRDGKANITGGDLTISEERKNYMLFSDPLYECKVALAVRVDSKKDELPITIEDAEFNVKPENIIDVNVKFGDTIKKSSCLFPSFFNDTFLINCTISDIKDVNVSNGFEFVSTDDKILILYNYIEANSFFQANKLIDGHPNIIQQGNTSNIVCQSSSSVLVTSLLIFGGILSLILFILWRLL